MDGKVIEWNPFNQNGKVSNSASTNPFALRDCSPSLASALNKTPLPIDVTYDIDGTGWAINLDLAPGISIAASAEN
jgi:hypothetical protein